MGARSSMSLERDQDCGVIGPRQGISLHVLLFFLIYLFCNHSINYFSAFNNVFLSILLTHDASIQTSLLNASMYFVIRGFISKRMREMEVSLLMEIITSMSLPKVEWSELDNAP